jgi:hypothetical protein
VTTGSVVTCNGLDSLGLEGAFLFAREATGGLSSGFPDAIQPVPNRLLYSAASLLLLFSTGNSFRLSCSTSRLTRPFAPSSLPDGTSGDMIFHTVRVDRFHVGCYLVQTIGCYFYHPAADIHQGYFVACRCPYRGSTPETI